MASAIDGMVHAHHPNQRLCPQPTRQSVADQGCTASFDHLVMEAGAGVWESCRCVPTSRQMGAHVTAAC